MNIKKRNWIGGSIMFGAAMALSFQASFASLGGRIAYVADGNSDDSDDMMASAVAIAMLKASGDSDKLVHCSHSCDLVVPSSPFNNQTTRQAAMQDSCDGTASRWGSFPNVTKFFNCFQERNAAAADLRNAIMASSAGDLLWICEAGEPDIIYDAMVGATADKRQHVRIITHSSVNDGTGDFHNLVDIIALNGFTESRVHRIKDQNQFSNPNAGLHSPMSSWNWANNHPDNRIQWLWDRGFESQLPEYDEPGTHAGIYDCSDAGMVWYWAMNGDQDANVSKLQTFFLNYVNNNSGGNGSTVTLRRRSDMGFGIDGNNGGANNQNVYMWNHNPNNVNQQWEEISRGGGFYTYKKKNTVYTLDGGGGPASNDDNVYLWTEGVTNQNQHWKKISMGGGYYRLEKRNAPSHSIDGGGGAGFNGQNVKLWQSDNNNWNQHWFIQ